MMVHVGVYLYGMGIAMYMAVKGLLSVMDCVVVKLLLCVVVVVLRFNSNSEHMVLAILFFPMNFMWLFRIP